VVLLSGFLLGALLGEDLGLQLELPLLHELSAELLLVFWLNVVLELLLSFDVGLWVLNLINFGIRGVVGASVVWTLLLRRSVTITCVFLALQEPVVVGVVVHFVLEVQSYILLRELVHDLGREFL